MESEIIAPLHIDHSRSESNGVTQSERKTRKRVTDLFASNCRIETNMGRAIECTLDARRMFPYGSKPKKEIKDERVLWYPTEKPPSKHFEQCTAMQMVLARHERALRDGDCLAANDSVEWFLNEDLDAATKFDNVPSGSTGKVIVY